MKKPIVKKFPGNEKENAKQKALAIIEAENQKEIETATKELNEFLKVWSEKHGCVLDIRGHFSGDKIQKSIEVVKVNG